MEQLDPAGAVRDVGRYIREQRHQAELSLRNLARQAGVSNPYLSQIERGLRQPSAKILKDTDEQAGDLIATILREPHLTERQKQVLIEIYQSFRATSEANPDPDGTRAAAPAAEPTI